MKRSLIMSIAAVLAVVAVIVVGTLYYTSNEEKTKKIDALLTDVTERDQRIESLEKELAEKTEQIETLTAEALAREDQIEALNAVIEENNQKTAQQEEAADGQSRTDEANGDPADGSLILYYEPGNGAYYHIDRNCRVVNRKYLPLEGQFTYAELEAGEHSDLEPCSICGAPARPAGSGGTDDA